MDEKERKENKDEKKDDIRTVTIKAPTIVKKEDVRSITVKAPTIIKKEDVRSIRIKASAIFKKEEITHKTQTSYNFEHISNPNFSSLNLDKYINNDTIYRTSLKEEEGLFNHEKKELYPYILKYLDDLVKKGYNTNDINDIIQNERYQFSRDDKKKEQIYETLRIVFFAFYKAKDKQDLIDHLRAEYFFVDCNEIDKLIEEIRIELKLYTGDELYKNWIQNSKDAEIEELINILIKDNQNESSIVLAEKEAEELIKVEEKKSEAFKNVYAEENQEPQTLMMNIQPKKERERSVLTINKFLDEELEFLKEERILIQDSDSKWSWLTSELAEKYFISVLLPFYIVKPNLSYAELEQLGFEAFRSKIQRTQGIHFSDIKNKYLNLDTQKLIKLLIKIFGTDKANKKLENAKNRLENILEIVDRVTISHNRDKIRLCLDLGFSLIKCEECDIGIDLLVALQLHHPTKLKEIILKNLYSKPKEEYKLILEKFKNDKVRLLCSNHHLEKQLFYPITFKEIIFKEDLFSMSAEEIDAYIDEYLSIFSKTKRYKEIIYEKYTSKNKKLPSDIHIKWKYGIKIWIKKRFVFKELFDGKCVVCGDSNLLHLELHHIDPKLKDNKWKSIANLNCDDIMSLIIKERCVCLCSNCHALITYKYHISIREVLKGFFAQHEIDKILEEITLKYNNAIKKISNFSYNLKNINFKCPLKLEFSQDDLWELHFMMVYYYLEIKERSFFFRNEILYDLDLPQGFIFSSIKNLIDMSYIQAFNSKFLIKYSLTEKGKDKISKLIQEHYKKANNIKDQIKNSLNNKGKYDFLDYTYSKNDKCFIRKKNYSKEEIIFKYCTIIYDFIMSKSINEFTTRELLLLFNNNRTELSNMTIIGQILRSYLAPLNLIEKIDNSTSYQRINPSSEIEESKISIGLTAKIYKLTEKGIDFAKNGFENLYKLEML